MTFNAFGESVRADDPPAVARLMLAAGTAAAWNADGSLLLTAGGTDVQVCDGRTYDPVGDPLRLEARVAAAVFSPDGARVAAAADASVPIDERSDRRPPAR